MKQIKATLKKALTLLLLLVLFQWSSAQEVASAADTLTQQAPLALHSHSTSKAAADSSYIQGDFATAIQQYENLLSKGKESAEIYYNLGNAYYKSQEIARAILSYERSLLLNPGDRDTRFNLLLAQSKTVDKVEAPYELFLMVWLKEMIHLLSLKSWSLIAIFTFVLLLLFTLLFHLTHQNRYRKFYFIGALSMLLFTLVANLSALHQYHYLTHRNEAIVMLPSVTAKSTPGASGTDLFILHEGHKVKITDDSMKEWKEIELGDGNIGWIPTQSIEKI